MLPPTPLRGAAKLALVCAALLAATASSATEVMHVPLARMATQSDVIVEAQVLGHKVTWDDSHTRILTLTQIRVLQALKGASKGEVLTIYQVGGSLDHMTLAIPGALHFVDGEQMVFFAMRFRTMIVSYGMGLGKYRIDTTGPTPMVLPEYGDVEFVKRRPDGSFAPAPIPATGPEPLSTFLQRVRTALGGGTP